MENKDFENFEKRLNNDLYTTVKPVEDNSDFAKFEKKISPITNSFKTTSTAALAGQPIYGYSKYGEHTRTDPNFKEKLLAMQQGMGAEALNALGRIIPNTALTIIGNLASIADIEDYANTDNEVGNWLTALTERGKQGVNKALPIYRENPNKPLDIGDSAYWFENGSSLVESAGAFVATGMLTGGALLKAIGNGAKALKWLSTAGKTAQLGDTGKKIAQRVSAVSNAIALNQAESIGIATSVYKETY